MLWDVYGRRLMFKGFEKLGERKITLTSQIYINVDAKTQ